MKRMGEWTNREMHYMFVAQFLLNHGDFVTGRSQIVGIITIVRLKRRQQRSHLLLVSLKKSRD
jgi:hypothetical protein